MSAIKYWLWLSSLTNVRPSSKAALIDHYGDAERAWFAPEGEFRTVPGVSAGDAAVLEARDMSACDNILSECDRQGIDILTMQDARYPRWLCNTYAPPPVLYVKGRLPNVDDTPAIAIVGTRRASPYGLKMARTLAFEIVRCGGIIVSGLTEGVDRAAAEGCLLAGGRCIGVLGTPHGEDNRLQRDVAATGALISEYPPGTVTQKFFFRDRNRVSAGLSQGVVVVEAPERSGSLLFAQEALEQGREIFAVPGNADAENSVGTIRLIKDGAKPVTGGWDVMCEFEALFPDKIVKPSGRISVPAEVKNVPPERAKPAAKQEKTPVSTKKEIDNNITKGYIDLSEQLSQLNEEQLKIITAIGGEQTHIDDVIERTGLSPAKVLSQLTVLEIKGYIRRIPGRRVSLNTAMK